MPELNEYTYSNGGVYFCSGFVMAAIQKGGVLKDFKFNWNEFAPADVFELNIWDDKKSNLPEICRNNDPDLPYCMIGGKYQTPHNLRNRDYNSVNPYNNMNERCNIGYNNYYARYPKNC